MKRTPPGNRRSFEGDWDRILYLYDKLLHWLYGMHNRRRAVKFSAPLKSLLAARVGHTAIKGEECWSLVCEAEGDLPSAIKYRRSEIRLIKRLRKLMRHPPEYGPDDLADRYDLLAILYHDAGRLDSAIAALKESRKICSRARIRFDGAKLMKDYLREKGRLA